MPQGMTGAGPVISALPETREMSTAFEMMELRRLKPQVFRYDGTQRVLDTIRRFPDPTQASPTAPEVIGMVYETPGVVPELAWEDFVKGAACVANIIAEPYREGVAAGVKQLGEHMIAGGDLPDLDVLFSLEILECLDRIFTNGEPASWRRLIAFLHGAFWVLTYVKDPKKKRSGVSPLDWTTKVVGTFAELAYIPQ